LYSSVLEQHERYKGFFISTIPFFSLYIEKHQNKSFLTPKKVKKHAKTPTPEWHIAILKKFLLFLYNQDN
jgi:hypothetical protein